MKSFDRTWPLSLTAIAAGGLVAFVVTGPFHIHVGTADHHVLHLGASADHVAREQTAIPPTAFRHAPAPRPEMAPVRSLPRVGTAENPPIVVRFRGEKSIDQLLDILRRSRDANERRAAAVLLGSNRDVPPSVLPALMIALRTDASSAVRAKAAESLGRIGSPASVGSLHLAASQDADTQVQRAAVVALGEVGDASSRKVLLQIIEREGASELRTQAALAIQRLDARVLRSR